MPQFNLIAILVSAFVYFMIGGLWYGLLFSKPWMKLMGMPANYKPTASDQKNAMVGYACSLATAVLMAFLLSYFLFAKGVTTFAEGTRIGFYTWLGFVLPTMLPNHTFSMHKKPFKLFAINGSYPLVGLTLLGGILAVWK
jgi:hypothetical protein